MGDRPIPTMPKLRWTADDYRQRPREYDPLCADIIIDHVNNGETLSVICLNDRDLPLPGTFLLWTEQEPELAVRYNDALRRGTDLNFGRIAEEATNADGMSSIRIAGLKHYTERAYPEKYGPRSIIKNLTPKDQENELPGGYDFTAEFRRKIESMAKRIALSKENPPAEE